MIAVLAVLAALLAVPAAAVSAEEPSGETSGEGASEPTEEQVAEETLDAVQEALADAAPPVLGAEAESRHLTLLLRDLYLVQDDLSGADARVAARLLARPAATRSDCGPGKPGEKSPFCIHWVTSGKDAPPLTDTSPANGIPDQVDRTRATFATVWQRIVAQGGYRAPLPDRTGPDDRFDVYLSDVGGDGLYGYCQGEQPAAGAATSSTTLAAFCELDDDYASSQFPDQTPLTNLQVTAAHEFYHAVQYAYDAWEDVWLLEGTAAWVEDEVYDNVDDNRQYLKDSPLSAPSSPLDRTDAGLSVYGSWIWWRYLAERYPGEAGTGMPVVLRRILERASGSSGGPVGVWSLQAVKRELKTKGATLPSTFASFAAANRAPASFYEEGAGYSAAPLRDRWRLKKARRGSGEQSVRLPHLSSASYAFRRGKGINGGAWKLRVKVDMPNRGTLPRAVVTVIDSDGSRSESFVTLTRKGVGKSVVPFGASTKAVELTLANGGHDYRCDQGTQYACSGGTPLDDNRRSTLRATAFRPS